MRRRELIVLASGVAVFWPPAARSQASNRPPHVGVLTPAASDQTAVFAALRKGFADLGYIDGKTMVLDYRFAKGDSGALPKLARELVDAAVDVIVTDGVALIAASRATRTIPIVCAVGPDPVALGMAASVGHPGGNVTGFNIRVIELMGKRLQMLKYAFPRLARVAVLINPNSSSGRTEALRTYRQAARKNSTLSSPLSRPATPTPCARWGPPRWPEPTG